MIRTFSIQSGSNGNSIYVEAGGLRLLFDAGIPCRTAMARMAARGALFERIDAIIVSHEHTDHVCGLGAIHRKCGAPVHATRATWSHVSRVAGKVGPLHHFRPGETLRFGEVAVHTLRTPHDAVEGSAFVVEHAGKRLGIMTDLGHAFAALRKAMGTLDAVYLESNYDPALLATCSYPEHLKARIRGSGGHISNAESAELVDRDGSARLQWVALAHLSANSNTPERALATHRAVHGSRHRTFVAGRDAASEVMVVE